MVPVYDTTSGNGLYNNNNSMAMPTERATAAEADFEDVKLSGPEQDTVRGLKILNIAEF
jgi:hypothetical protein